MAEYRMPPREKHELARPRMLRRRLLMDLCGGRLETGVMQYGDDWPGVFIRGDDAAAFALAVRYALETMPADPPHVQRQYLEDLRELLESCEAEGPGSCPHETTRKHRSFFGGREIKLCFDCGEELPLSEGD